MELAKVLNELIVLHFMDITSICGSAEGGRLLRAVVTTMEGRFVSEC